MFLRIRHQLRFSYDRPVFLEPAVVRLTPRQDSTQRVLEHDIDISPQPQGAAWSIEPDGSDARCMWFTDTHDELCITGTSIVQTLRDNPFDIVLTHPPAQALPAAYPPPLTAALSSMLAGPVCESVQQWADELAADAGRETLTFLIRLTEAIHASFSIVDRAEGEPYSPQHTLATRSGACRDVTMLFVAACRSQNIAARFVSGYSLNASEDSPRHELHAWAEVYLPGGGWRGYDPSLGLAVADQHVALASGPDHRLAAPFTGSFRGTDARSTLEYDITLDASEQDEALTS